MRDDEVDPEVPALRGLRLEEPPPPGDEEQIVRRLKAARLLEPESGRTWKLVAAALLLFGAFVAGWLAARSEGGRSNANRYVLLLYGAPAVRSSARVEEYREWAREQREMGREVRGERLGTSEVVVGGSAPAGLLLQGFFVITAEDEPDAVDVARSHPHVRQGGLVVVRPIEPT